MNLTNEEIRVKVAEAMGLHTRHCLGFTMTHAAFREGLKGEWKHFNSEEEADDWNKTFQTPEWEKKPYTNTSLLPNYPEDLNAANEMEETLSEEERPVYVNNLYLIALEYQRLTGKWRYSSLPARQRCLAYLKTKGILP